jgi:hypothetical protein
MAGAVTSSTTISCLVDYHKLSNSATLRLHVSYFVQVMRADLYSTYRKQKDRGRMAVVSSLKKRSA